MKVEIWSDVVCPWCYIGKRRFEAALARFPHRDEVEVVWRSFELDATAPQELPESLAEHLAAKYGMSLAQARAAQAHMTQTAAAEGIEFRFDDARSGNTVDAHRVIHLAEEQGRQGSMKERLLRAYFTEGELVSDHDTLARLAEEVGLDGAAVREMLASDRLLDEVRADERQAARYGISGVPFFVVDDRFGVSGAQPADVLLEVLETAWAESHPLTMVTVPSAAGQGVDACADGSCAL